MKKVSDLTLFASLVVVVVALLTCLIWLVKPYKTADIVEPISVLNINREVAPGEPIQMELHITKYNSYPVEGSNSILCDTGRIYIIQSMTTKLSPSLPTGTFVRFQNKYKAPLDVSPGTKCHFVFRNSYKVNPIRTIIRQWNSETFTIK